MPLRAASSRLRTGTFATMLLGAAALAASGARPASAAGNAVSPATGNMLTCSTVQFRTATPVDKTKAQWRSTNVWGTVDAVSGLYTAPTTAANHPTGGVALLGLPGSSTLVYGSVNLPLATAFPSASATVPVATDLRGVMANVPYEHAFSANASRVYTVAGPIPPGGGSRVDVLVSIDGGLTFAAGASIPITNVLCATIAADAGDSNVAYLVTKGQHSLTDSAWQVRVAVSSDGGMTFPKSTAYVIADSTNLSYQLGDLNCPDVISPSRGHVVATAAIPAPNNSGNIAIWAADNYGAGNGTAVGPQGGLGPVLSTFVAAASPTYAGIYGLNRQTAPDRVAGYQTNNLYDGPRLFTNGAKTVCVGYDTLPQNTVGASLYLQCSSDSGATWTAQKLISTPVGVNDHNPLFGSVSPSGKVAVSYLVGTAPDVDVKLFPDATLTTATPRIFSYPSASRAAFAGGSSTSRPVLAWEGDDVLWLAQSLNRSNAPNLIVDKLCDPSGTSPVWSGAVSVGGFVGTSLISTGRGMVAGAFLPNTASYTIGLETGVVH